MTEEAVKMLMQLNKEGFDTAVKRYELLRAISYVQPVGAAAACAVYRPHRA